MVEHKYDPRTVESRWQEVWQRTRLYEVDLERAGRPFYNLMEFPYPSGEGLHVGHTYSFGGADSYGRFQRMRGFDVFQPMGFDAFGIHAENYALRLGIHPAELIPRNVRRFREEQLKRMGAAFDWTREVNTSDPRYYRWTQWIFLQLYKGGLAYRAPSAVNWCPSCLTTLADEQVVGGRCERCDTPVTRRTLTQWFFRITRYAEELLDFSQADYSETTQSLQRHWIGRREGAGIDFQVVGSDERITVFTTRPETLFGATFLVLAPEHPAALRIADATRAPEVASYIEHAAQRGEVERLATTNAKTGAFTGAEVINPVDGRRLTVWVADYVLMGFGTGAIFATPAHDQRDWEFAQARGLPIIPVVRPTDGDIDALLHSGAYEGDGTMINSGPYNGMTVEEARAAMVKDLAAHDLGHPRVTYRLRDWLISRQRYWGPPIPMVYCDRCGEVPVPEEDLPVLPPETEHFRPLGTGESPLAAVPEFVHTACPRCGGPARRETDVSDNFLDSAWYYLRYTSTEFDDRPWDNDRLRRWLPVSMYVGGVEHSTLHHLYARFLWKALRCTQRRDLGYIPPELGPEPFARLKLHGLIIRGGRRMSKSRGNVVNPDAYIARYGADVLRMNLLFMGRFEEGGDFSDAGITGLVRFANRVWRLAAKPEGDGSSASAEELASEMPLVRTMHRTVRKVTEDMETMAFNTAIAALMGYLNVLQAWQGRAAGAVWDEAVRTLLLMLAPLTPHLAEELWAQRGLPYSIHQQPWPRWDPALAAEETITLVVQVDGRVRARVEALADIDAEAGRRLALGNEQVRGYLDGRKIRRVVYVQGKLVNVVTR
jgi:leucyl-tRNA synthetase